MTEEYTLIVQNDGAVEIINPNTNEIIYHFDSRDMVAKEVTDVIENYKEGS